jgi:hypothetical protein
LVSKDEIIEATKSPFALRKSFASYSLQYGAVEPTIYVGRDQFKAVEILIRVLGENVLWIEPPEEIKGPFRFNAILRDAEENVILKIVSNEWQIGVDNWDVVTTYNSLKIWSHNRNVSIFVKFDPPKIMFEKIKMVYKGVSISCSLNGDLEIQFGKSAFRQSGSSLYENCDVGVEVFSDGFVVGSGCGSLTSL